jgi:hypothetical protein
VGKLLIIPPHLDFTPTSVSISHTNTSRTLLFLSFDF